MKVTVGAIRQIVREEAERLNEASAETASSQQIRDAFGPTSTMTKKLLDIQAGPLRNHLIAFLVGLTEKVDDMSVQDLRIAAQRLKIDLGEVSADEEEVQNESYNSDELRSMIMAEASNLLGE